MLPAGPATEETIGHAELAQPGDMIIDGGNSFYKDDIRRAKALAEKGIHYVDVGTSGGVWGLERGYCMMIGGDKEVGRSARSDLRGAGARLGTIPRTPNQGRKRRRSRAERAISMPARPAPAISSRWSTTASNMA
jgi:6-phosphogluconate dehydrogenase